MTKKEMFNLIATVNEDNAEIVAFCNKEIALLEKKTSNRKPSKNQVANEDLKAIILEVLETKGATVTQIIAKAGLEITNQKGSSLVNALVKDGLATKWADKKSTLFGLKEDVTEDVETESLEEVETEVEETE